MLPVTLPPQTVTVYGRTDEFSNIIAVASNHFIVDTQGWVALEKYTDKGEPARDRYIYASDKYFENGLTNDSGVYLYKYDLKSTPHWRAKDQEEIAADIAAIPPGPIPDTVLLKAQVQALTDRNEFLEDCIAEMATIIYG